MRASRSRTTSAVSGVCSDVVIRVPTCPVRGIQALRDAATICPRIVVRFGKTHGCSTAAGSYRFFAGRFIIARTASPILFTRVSGFFASSTASAHSR